MANKVYNKMGAPEVMFHNSQPKNKRYILCVGPLIKKIGENVISIDSI